MMNSKGMRFSIFIFFSFILISVCATVCVGEVLFEEYFEEGDIDGDKR